MIEGVNGVIFIGGPKTDRLKPLLRETPFCLMCVAGAKILDHLMNSLIESQVDEIFIVGAYENSMISEFCLRKSSTSGHHIRYLKTEHYETAEILKELWGVLFGQDEVENLIIMPSNIVIDFSFNELLEQHIKTKKLMTILANEIDTSKPNLNGYILSKDGTNVDYYLTERPNSSLSYQSMGIQVISKKIHPFVASYEQSVIKKMKAYCSNNSNYLQPMKIDLPYIIIKQIDPEKNMGLLSIKGQIGSHMWLNTVHDLINANKIAMNSYENDAKYLIVQSLGFTRREIREMKTNYVMKAKSSKVDPTAFVKSKIGENCYIGKGVKVGKSVRIKNSIILGGCEIGDYSYIVDTIVAWNTRVERWARIEGSREKATASFLGVGCFVAEGAHIEGCVVLPYKEVFDRFKDMTVL